MCVCVDSCCCGRQTSGNEGRLGVLLQFLTRCWPNDSSSSPLVSRESLGWRGAVGFSRRKAGQRWAAFQSPHLQAGADSVSLLFLFYRIKCGWSELSQFRPVLPAGGRRYFFKKETKKSDQAQGVSVVAKYLSSSAARDAQEGRWRKLDEARLPEGKSKWEECVCVWKQGSWL